MHNLEILFQNTKGAICFKTGSAWCVLKMVELQLILLNSKFELIGHYNFSSHLTEVTESCYLAGMGTYILKRM
jgi:hypothetical protein